MKLLILGATGPTGGHVLDAALRHGDEVTVLARNPAALDAYSGRVAVVRVNAASADDIAAALQGQDAVICTLGRSTSIKAEGLFSKSSAALLAVAGRAGVRRTVWLSSFGVGDTYAEASFIQKLMYRTFLRWIYADKKIADEAIRASGLDWTIVYPSRLTNGPTRATYRVDDHIRMTGDRTISRADLGAFIHDAVHDAGWIGRNAVITD